MTEPHVAEHRRYCRQCDERVGRGRGEQPGRTEGYCTRCGTPFSFLAKLSRGDVVSGQYEIAGCLAHGGLGWIYLARDRHVSDRWVVLKGVLDTADEQAVAAVLAERRFLAEVEHPNIVKIHNFVEHGGDGYIVMEFVNGVSLQALLDARRAENGGRPDPLPVTQAIAYCLEILPALGYLHDAGLAYCDFKPDNVIQSAGTLKLIDLGGVYRIDEAGGAIYGTPGYQAPEVPRTGPTVESDLYTVGRTLAVLCTDFAGLQGAYRTSLPARRDVPLYSRYDSLYRFLERATAVDPARRFRHADEMAAQLEGILREIVAAETGRAAPGVSTAFAPPQVGARGGAGWHNLPAPLVAPDDPAAAIILAIGRADPETVATQRAATPSVELDLWLARALIDAGRVGEAKAVLAEASPAGWRAHWYAGVADATAGDLASAEARFHDVYAALPGESAPKLALAMTVEAAGDHLTAASWYDVVSRTDPAFTAAAFGLARCRRALGDADGAVEAYGRVPDTSHAHVDAQVAAARTLLAGAGPHSVPDLARAAAIVHHIAPDGEQRDRLTAEVLEAALAAVRSGGQEDASIVLLAHPLTDRDLRLGLEATYRSLAHRAATTGERVALVDRANRIRPRSWW